MAAPALETPQISQPHPREASRASEANETNRGGRRHRGRGRNRGGRASHGGNDRRGASAIVEHQSSDRSLRPRGRAGRAGDRGGRTAQHTNATRIGTGTGRRFAGQLTRPDTSEQSHDNSTQRITGSTGDETVSLRADAPEFVPGAPSCTAPQLRPKPSKAPKTKSSASDIATRTHEDIQNGFYECPICTSELGRRSKGRQWSAQEGVNKKILNRFLDSGGVLGATCHKRLCRLLIVAGAKRRSIRDHYLAYHHILVAKHAPSLGMDVHTRVIRFVMLDHVPLVRQWDQPKHVFADATNLRKDAWIQIMRKVGAVWRYVLMPSAIAGMRPRRYDVTKKEWRSKVNVELNWEKLLGRIRPGWVHLAVELYAIVYMTVVSIIVDSRVILRLEQCRTVLLLRMWFGIVSVENLSFPHYSESKHGPHIIVRNYVIRASAKRAPKLFSKKCHVIAAEQYFTLRSPAGLVLQHAISTASDLNRADIHKRPTAVTWTMKIAQSVRFWWKRSVFVDEHRRSNLAHSQTSNVPLRVLNLQNAVRIFVGSIAIDQEIARIRKYPAKNHVESASKRCHAPFPCSESTLCQSRVTITCACGRMAEEKRCNATREKPRSPDEKLKCDDECARLQRNRGLASALNVDIDPTTTVSAGVQDSNPIPYSDETLDLYIQASSSSTLATLQGYEATFHSLATQTTQKSTRFPPCRSQLRAFIHSLAADWGFESESFDPEPVRHVLAYKPPGWQSPGVAATGQPKIGIRGLSISECIKLRDRDRMKEKEAKRAAAEKARREAEEEGTGWAATERRDEHGWSKVASKKKPQWWIDNDAPKAVPAAPTSQSRIGGSSFGSGRFGSLILKSGVGRGKEMGTSNSRPSSSDGLKKPAPVELEEVVDDWEEEIEKEEKEQEEGKRDKEGPSDIEEQPWDRSLEGESEPHIIETGEPVAK
ncbi:predicted protein [Uncinocarpus reesii 1704]|uniref:R3H domain-containing protein n=1 Tax=Uncinocarpus reesii (strain UAMH 1704) TaxID=336963 RepID=C4JPF4_UNCRE|nr:uncharacterized protein UREG_04536 [Uncinocarpus reesii 1704]EEP79690.1 predicted protein [Uncinocarpus reesii 1704]